MRRARNGGRALALGTAGLAALAAPAAAQVELSLGGYMKQYLSYTDVDTDGGLPSGDNFSGFDVKSNSEVWFVGSTTLDNGLKFGVNIQLEGNTNTADQIDESFLFVEGSFGRFNLGSENSAGYLMTVVAPNVGIDTTDSTVLPSFLPQDGAFAGAGFTRSPLQTTYVELDRANDSEKITYFTPRIEGLQLGASYLPDPLQDSNLQVDEETVSFRDGFSLGGNFQRSVAGIEIEASARYDWADDESPAGTDPSLWSAGLNLGYAGFTLGGSYAETSDMGPDSGRNFDVGLSYATGPWSLSLTYIDGRAQATAAPGDSSLKVYEGAALYELGPGVDLGGSILYLDLDADSGAESRSLAVVSSVQLTF